MPWSPGATKDDRVLPSDSHFRTSEIVVTEKLDGENTTIYSDGYVHARSLDSVSHPTQSWVRALAASIAHELPVGWRVCGENVYAKHSIKYDKLSSYFFVFAIYDDHNVCLSWSDTVEWASTLGLQTAPVLYRGPYDPELVMSLYDGVSRFGDVAEGYVLRVSDSFPFKYFSSSVAKYVRKGHVAKGSAHWKYTVITPNIMVGVQDEY